MSSPRVVPGKSYRRTWEKKRRKPPPPPEDPAVVAERERWDKLIDAATIHASTAIVAAHLRRQLEMARASIVPEPEAPPYPPKVSP